VNRELGGRRKKTIGQEKERKEQRARRRKEANRQVGEGNERTES
jgi:hypothetical protein